ncbi:hypothetical protein QBC32DRAFT_381230 [Pseudoneurospora amorphoporcata]|uniref:Uncharacterized protein n=1 Tax=Pseudoneurospora amorphoporcata TaxID=241081 RepID=A0AAN6SI21_9PEZI|nr:hypothetical protein QBC32DRAFT_381230 [Pseudoneurospora amorphoporcata]
MASLIRRPSESCPPHPARYPRSERNTRQDDTISHHSHRRQSSPALTHRRRKSRRSTSVTSDDNHSRISTIDEDYKDDPESDYHPRDVYYLSQPSNQDHDRDEEKNQWDLDLEAGDATSMNRRGEHDDDARSTRSRGRIPRPSTIVRRPSTIGTLSPRTRSPIDQSRRQSMRPDNLSGTDHYRRDSVRSRPRREPHQEASDSETAVSPCTRPRRHINRSPTPPHRGSVAYDHKYSRPRPRSSTIPHHQPTYTDDDDEDEREDSYHHHHNNNNPRHYHRRAHSNPPLPSTSHRHHSYPSNHAHRPSLSSTLNFKDLKSSPKAASLLKAASRALEAGAATALKLRKDSPSTPLFSAASGSKIAAAALGAAVVDGLIEHEHKRHPKLMRKGGLRHHVVKQVVQRGVAGLVGGIIEEGLTGGKKEEEKKGRKKESVKRVVKGAVRDYEKWEKGKGDGGNGSGKEEKGGRNERERERERDTDGEGRRERTRERERERGREGSVRSRRR